ncbi:hypothetical protein, partial [Roseibacillus ishigakijimensis]
SIFPHHHRLAEPSTGRTLGSTSDKTLELGPSDRIVPYCDCPEGAWEIPIYDDGYVIRSFPVPPPVAHWQKMGEEWDDSDFFDAEPEKNLKEKLGVEIDPMMELATLLRQGLPVEGEFLYNDPVGDGHYIFEEEEKARLFYNLLVKLGMITLHDKN